jgi:hypothetical protein
MKRMSLMFFIIIAFAASVYGQDRYFDTELPIPPVLEETKPNYYELEAVEGKKIFFSEIETSTLGYNSNYLGPNNKSRERAEGQH